MPTFPGEICDLIIDQLGVSKGCSAVLPSNRELAACAMVCRDWVPRSRSHQFKSLDFSSSSSRDRLSPLLDLLSFPHATIAPHVRQIMLSFGAQRNMIPNSVFMRIGALSALRSITIRGYTSGDFPRVEDIVTILGSLAELTRLELYYFTLESFIQLRDIVCACRVLERLYIFHLGTTYRSPAPPQIPLYVPLASFPLPPLRVLKMTHSIFTEQLLAWIESCIHLLPLSSLWLDLGAIVLCGRLLRAIGSKLEHLSLQFGDSDRYKHVSYENVDLRYNSRLETLSFWGCGAPVIRHNGLDIINRVSSNNLRELNISLDWLSIGDLNRIEHVGAESLPELAAIDTLLQRPNFANLEELNIGLPRVVNSMQDFFPRTSARDLLHVICYSKMEHLGRHTQVRLWM